MRSRKLNCCAYRSKPDSNSTHVGEDGPSWGDFDQLEAKLGSIPKSSANFAANCANSGGRRSVLGRFRPTLPELGESWGDVDESRFDNSGVSSIHFCANLAKFGPVSSNLGRRSSLPGYGAIRVRLGQNRPHRPISGSTDLQKSSSRAPAFVGAIAGRELADVAPPELSQPLSPPNGAVCSARSAQQPSL